MEFLRNFGDLFQICYLDKPFTGFCPGHGSIPLLSCKAEICGRSFYYLGVLGTNCSSLTIHSKSILWRDVLVLAECNTWLMDTSQKITISVVLTSPVCFTFADHTVHYSQLTEPRNASRYRLSSQRSLYFVLHFANQLSQFLTMHRTVIRNLKIVRTADRPNVASPMPAFTLPIGLSNLATACGLRPYGPTCQSLGASST